MTIISVLSADHGEMTGLTLFHVVGHQIEPQVQHQLPWYEATLWFEEVCKRWSPGTLLVAGERFVITPNSGKMMQGEQHWTIEGIGCARRDARKYGHDKVVLYTASDAKKFVSNANLKKVGWDCPTPGNHARDATRVAIIAAADVLKIVPPWV